MRSLATALLLLAFATQANAICVVPTDHDPREILKQAQTVFVATITEAQLDPNYQIAKDQTRSNPWYTVRYAFDVAIPIKGDPSSVPYLATSGVYNDPRSKRHGVFGEQSRFVPGDNILVVANTPGPVPISWLRGCSDSMPWDSQARELLKRSGLRYAP
jgi:hypothetical protein